MLRHDHAAGALGVRPVAALDARGLLAEPAQELAAVGDLAARLGERLAHLDRHEQREVLLALLQQVERAAQDLGALARRRRRPRRERLDRGIQRRLAVGGRGVRDLLDDRAGRRVVDLQRLAALGGAPLAADEQRVGHARQQFGLTVVGHGDSLVVCSADAADAAASAHRWLVPILPACGSAGRCTRRTAAAVALSPRWTVLVSRDRRRRRAAGQQEPREERRELVGRRERQHRSRRTGRGAPRRRTPSRGRCRARSKMSVVQALGRA